MRISLSYCKSNCNDFDLYLIYTGAGFHLYVFLAGLIIDIILFNADDLYLIYTDMNSSCMYFRQVRRLRFAYFADNLYLIYAGMGFHLYLYYAGLMIGIVLFYEDDLYLIYAYMNSSCMYFKHV
ncbi:hypothetical protein [Chryseobacterium balustinum]|uniref:Uncharacterized protein n=1 Tax=Chryseobacterium balustinum TaxID=246 RepID=A0AAX2IR89_9FLAO|nr:hypothetical protein [Chryseobacterium balustinum]SKC11915.1 hypothetical protein SAMN05421800_13710 [Chryseobacterium balustinum]SQA92735.1 Uncharacterised protein [Chryseobacterium balustinum]